MRQRAANPARTNLDARNPASAIVIALLFLIAYAQGGAAGATHSSSTIGLLAIDANSEANAATSLGPVNGCSRIEPGAQTTVDYVVDAIPQDRALIGFEAEVRYDPQLLEVTDADYRLLLAAVGSHRPFGQSDEVPDSDGRLLMQVVDEQSMTDPEANVERGPGVLARLTVRAKTAGLANISIAVSRQPLVYPILLDTQNERIFADRIGSASLAIGQDCPVEAQQPVITEMAEVNEQILADNPQLAGGTPPAGGTAAPSTTITPEGQTPSPEESTPAPSPTTIPCAAPPRATPGASTTPAPPAAEGTTPPTDTPPPTPAVPVCTPTPTPVPDQIVNVDNDSNTPLIVGAAVLLAAGSAAAGSGWYLYRRSRTILPNP